MERRLSAIVAADVVGYSALMEQDEAGTFDRLRAHRKELFEPEIHKHHGRIFKLTGDGLFAEFASVVDAVECAVSLQRGLAERNANVPDDQRIDVRIGINLGEVIVEGDDRLGEGVNIAARLEQLAEPGGICVSAKVTREVEKKLAFGFESMGEQKVKNITEPVQVFKVRLDAPKVLRPSRRIRKTPFKILAASTIALLLILIAGGTVLWLQPWKTRIEPASVARMALPLPDKPSVAVLPFTNMSNTASEQPFADGITDDLITDLSKVAGLFVIARNSTFVYQGKPVKIAQVAQDLGVRYVLEGSVQRAGDQLRVNAQLIDALSGGHVWADRYDGNVRDIFSVQDEFVRKIVEGLQVKLTKQEQHEIASAKPDSVAAKEAFDEGWSLILRFNAKDNAAALEPLKRAVELDPEYGRAYAALALIFFRDYVYGWVLIDRSVKWPRDDTAIQYLKLASKYPTSLAHIVKADQLLYEGRGAEARWEAGQAIALDPNDPEAHIAMAWGLTIGGKPDEALSFISAAMRLNPNYPSHYVLAHGIALFAAGDLKKAAEVFDEGFRRNPQATMLLPPLASVLALLGRRQEAAQKLEIWRPGLSRLERGNMTDTYTFPFNWEQEHANVREHLLDGLRIAGLPVEMTVSTLLGDLKSDDPFQHQLAAKRLGWFGSAAAPAVPALIAALQDEIVREEAVKSLGKIGPDAKAAIPALTAIQNETLISAFVKEALIAIGNK